MSWYDRTMTNTHTETTNHSNKKNSIALVLSLMAVVLTAIIAVNVLIGPGTIAVPVLGFIGAFLGVRLLNLVTGKSSE